MTPHIIVGALLGVIAAFAGGFIKGMDYASAKCEVKITRMVDDARKQRDAEAEKANAASARLEAENAQARERYKKLQRSVDGVVSRANYGSACFDDDGLRLVNEALAGAGADSGESDDKVSRSAAAVVADIGRDSAPHR